MIIKIERLKGMKYINSIPFISKASFTSMYLFSVYCFMKIIRHYHNCYPKTETESDNNL